jgi:hypothetical protein
MSELPVHGNHAGTSMVSKSARGAADHANTDPFGVTAFSLIGLLFALNLMLRFPEIGALITQYNRF